jgi:hypothetical protein
MLPACVSFSMKCHGPRAFNSDTTFRSPVMSNPAFNFAPDRPTFRSLRPAVTESRDERIASFSTNDAAITAGRAAPVNDVCIAEHFRLIVAPTSFISCPQNSA